MRRQIAPRVASNGVDSVIENNHSNTVSLPPVSMTIPQLMLKKNMPRLITVEEFKEWLATTDANITFIGAPISGIGPRSAQDTIVTYCNKRVNNVCGGSCTVYNGGPRCLDAPGTQCLSATRNVGFCDRGGCGGSCNQFSTCGTRLDNNFCYTPGTRSILVGA